MCEMVVRVAEALEEVVPDGIEPLSVLMARAAMRAMDEPTAKMIKAGDWDHPNSDPRRLWRTMLKSAIAE